MANYSSLQPTVLINLVISYCSFYGNLILQVLRKMDAFNSSIHIVKSYM